MPRPGPRRPYVALRLAQNGLDWIDQLAAERGINRSEAMRIMLAYAQQKMPKNWKPKPVPEEPNKEGE